MIRKNIKGRTAGIIIGAMILASGAIVMRELARQDSAVHLVANGPINPGVAAGEPAPDFELKTKDGTETVKLSDHFGKEPVVLIFGSYT